MKSEIKLATEVAAKSVTASRGTERLLLTQADVDRFWLHVDRSAGVSGCWPWIGAKDKHGYGRFRARKADNRKLVTVLATQVALKLSGTEVPEGRCALHSCDNPPCCNYNKEHLFVGTQDDNVKDCVAKGRLNPGLPPIGSKNKWAKLTEADVTDIRRLRATGMKLADIAGQFGISIQAICSITTGRTWRRHP